MRLLRRAVGVLKDQNSIWISSLTRRTGLRNPEIESAVIRATSHDELSLDFHDIERAVRWVQISPFHLKPFLWSIANRMEKTRSWVVALKGLHLMHHLINGNIPCVNKMGRLPFDLSNFKDRHSSEAKGWCFNAFIHAYYTFLDHKSSLIFKYTEEKRECLSVMQELVLIQKIQVLIDSLIHIRPQGRVAFFPLVLDVMDGITLEIHNNYKRMCRGVAVVVVNIYSAGKAEAVLALSIVRKAASQGEDICFFFEFCKELGVINALKFTVDRIPGEGITELEQIVNEFTVGSSRLDEWKQNEEKAIVVREDEKIDTDRKDNLKNKSRTIITYNWKIFDDDFAPGNPFGSPSWTPHVQHEKEELPDLITF